MAKKKLFGNQKDPKCETCANGKLSVDGQSVLCVRGGALPLDHSCRHYVYDPLRRIPKRRPALGEYSAADFALDEQIADTTVEKDEVTPVIADQTLDHLLTYLGEHNTPDAETILSILAGTFHPEDEEIEIPEVPHTATDDTDIDALIEEHAAQANAALQPDDTPDIFNDLERLDMQNVPSFATEPIEEQDQPEMKPILNPDEIPSQFLTISDAPTDAPLEADDLLLIPNGRGAKANRPSPNVFFALNDSK